MNQNIMCCLEQEILGHLKYQYRFMFRQNYKSVFNEDYEVIKVKRHCVSTTV